jgi:hypothetical protein
MTACGLLLLTNAGFPRSAVVFGRARGRLVWSCRPAREQVQRLLRRRIGFGGVGDDGLPGVGRDLERVVVEGELTDERVVE